MSTIDAAFFYAEDDVTAMHIGGVAVLDGPALERDELFAHFETRSRRSPDTGSG